MAISTIKQQNMIKTEELSVSIPVGELYATGSISGFSYNPNDYIWSASICATSASNAYSRCFIEYLIISGDKIEVSINRVLRNDTSVAISCNVNLIGVHK